MSRPAEPPEHDRSAAPPPAGARRAHLRAQVARWARRRVTGRDVLVWLAVALAVLVPSAAFGVATASAEANLGPHRAFYEVTLDQRATADLGPLGTVVVRTPVPLLGLRVTIGEIPREITELGTPTTLEALSADLERYVQLFAAPQATAAVVARALVADAVVRTLAAAAVLTATGVALRWLLGPRRRAEILRALRPRRRRAALGATAGVLVLALVAAGAWSVNRPLPGPASRVFDETPLEGLVITGRLAGILDTYGTQVVDAYRDNQAFYAAAEENLRAEWEVREQAHARVLEVRRSAGLLPPRAPDAPDLVHLLVVSDLHCNVGMAPVIGAALEESGAAVLLDAGDTTTNGTAVERYCITAFDQAAGDVPVVVASGNHDSAETAAQQRSHGWTVLDGTVVEVEGVRILGAGDPRATRVGTGTVLETDETLPERATRLYDTACADGDGIDLLLTHDQQLGQEIVRDGCAPSQVSGHYHRRIGPLRTGAGVQYVSSSTAGALLGRPTIGPLSGVAEMTVLTFDPQVRRITEYQLIRVHPDTTVQVTHPTAWPSPPVGPLAPNDPGAPR